MRRMLQDIGWLFVDLLYFTCVVVEDVFFGGRKKRDVEEE